MPWMEAHDVNGPWASHNVCCWEKGCFVITVSGIGGKQTSSGAGRESGTNCPWRAQWLLCASVPEKEGESKMHLNLSVCSTGRNKTHSLRTPWWFCYRCSRRLPQHSGYNNTVDMMCLSVCVMCVYVPCSGADLSVLVREASVNALRAYLLTQPNPSYTGNTGLKTSRSSLPRYSCYCFMEHCKLGLLLTCISPCLPFRKLDFCLQRFLRQDKYRSQGHSICTVSSTRDLRY